MAGPIAIPSGGGLSTQIWDPDIIPSGLHADSWHPGDPVDGWSYLTDEGGAAASGTYGLSSGTVDKGWGPFKALPAGDCSATARITMDYAPPYGTFVTAGLFVGDLVGESSSTYDVVRLIQEWNGSIAPEFRAQYFTNGSFSAHLRTVTRAFRKLGGIYRIGVNSARTQARLSLSLDNGQSFINYYNYTPGTVALNDWGINLYVGAAASNINIHCHWFRVRTGTNEHLNMDPEGGFVL